MSRAPAAKAPDASRGSGAGSKRVAKGYLAQSQLPFASLIFILPFLILYELGTQHLTYDPATGTEQHIIAFKLMQDFFGFFGAHRRYLPAMAVVGILLAWHIARNDAWTVRPMVFFGMLIESLLLAAPLLLMSMVFPRYIPLAAVSPETMEHVVLNFGAGIYEELVFRLIAFGALSFILLDTLKMPKVWGTLAVVVISAVLFSLYHYLGNEPFQWQTFAFRASAGLFFGVVFIVRGFGITAGCHASYDLVITLFRSLA